MSRVKVPATLEELLDLMRAKGCASFDLEEQGVGGSPVKISVSLQLEVASVWAPPPPISREDTRAGFDATPTPARTPRVSDIELALNPPNLDLDSEEIADPSEALAPEAPRESAPAGAAEPNDSP